MPKGSQDFLRRTCGRPSLAHRDHARKIGRLKKRCTRAFYYYTISYHRFCLMIKKSRLRWFGHVERKDDNDWVKRCITWEVEGIRQRGIARKRPGGIVLRMTWKVYACPKRMHRPGINGEGELRGQLANPGSPGKMAVKTECVYVQGGPAKVKPLTFCW